MVFCALLSVLQSLVLIIKPVVFCFTGVGTFAVI